ncbi:hypothetical protein ACFQ3P_36760 [Paraburkholderia sabiae]|jgi:hypothetical protein|uniref:Uncharacterized protein n=1 Tax=Paraburkholderia sabiae TaxID=273251 RepID=A0ABU9QNT9_9BURK|nr:hypothetical protein [Paraburkholderia sabiae]WJZ72921.1 hypothetical protein QEN71_22595 [Paraburkholderia sabiae]CAD6562231.1 hypothetical protein LMG24235_07585 [Paraburkholderia sabiae]
MERFARLLPFRQFGRLRHLRNLVPCGSLTALASNVADRTASLFDDEAQPLPSAQPAFARVSLNSALNAEPARRAPVRVYHGPSRLIMVGTVDAVCNMIDRAIAEQGDQLAKQAA